MGHLSWRWECGKDGVGVHMHAPSLIQGKRELNPSLWKTFPEANLGGTKSIINLLRRCSLKQKHVTIMWQSCDNHELSTQPHYHHTTLCGLVVLSTWHQIFTDGSRQAIETYLSESIAKRRLRLANNPPPECLPSTSSLQTVPVSTGLETKQDGGSHYTDITPLTCQ